MILPVDQIEELRALCESISQCDEGGHTYLLLSKLRLPDGCQLALVDVLLCPMEREGYASRLFFAEKVGTREARNWNTSVRILERTWHAFSWRTQKGLRLAQMIAAHLKALR
jgi:hypothetical protein